MLAALCLGSTLAKAGNIPSVSSGEMGDNCVGGCGQDKKLSLIITEETEDHIPSFVLELCCQKWVVLASFMLLDVYGKYFVGMSDSACR